LRGRIAAARRSSRLFTRNLSFELSLEVLLSHLPKTERLVHLAHDVKRGHAIVLEVIEMRADLFVDEATNHRGDGQLLFGPLVHGPYPTRVSVLRSVCMMTA
jgi:hypothetical protein